jgi:excisionase family DNA binding protein
MPEQHYTVQHVASRLGVHAKTVYKLHRQGDLQGVKVGRVIRISEKSLDDYLARNMTAPQAAEAKKARPPSKSRSFIFFPP